MPETTPTSLRTCEFDDCGRPHKARGLCYTHWQQWRRGVQLSSIRQYRTQGDACSAGECELNPHAHGMCRSHYRQSRSGGDTAPIRRHFGGVPVATRMEWARREAEVTEAGCWLWPYKVNNYGYGVLRSGAKHLQSHRMSFALWVRPIPNGTVIHHACATRACFNPDHLQAVSSHENLAEMMGRKAYEAEIAALRSRVAELESKLRLHGHIR